MPSPRVYTVCSDALWLKLSATSVSSSLAFHARGAMESVECLVEAQYLVFLPVDDEVGRLAYVDLLGQLPIQESRLHAHVVD
jgi:hypothetical protein